MKDPIVKENKVVFGPCRLSYTHLLSKHAIEGEGEGKYSTNVIIPKGETKTVEAIKAAIEAARKAGIVSKWSGKEPKKLEMPLHDGEERDDEVYANSFYLNGSGRQVQEPYHGRGGGILRNMGVHLRDVLRL